MSPDVCFAKKTSPDVHFAKNTTLDVHFAEKCLWDKFKRLITLLLEDNLNTREYIHIEDEIAEGGLTDDEIVDAILNANKEKEEEPMADEIEIAPILEKVTEGRI
ncbi:11978_t:CDS:2 [Funneliformis mosseae]|uniref:11978_t:CDS:1 n=1 Tax=Funneliformis mosseae TaxID=27381 RepID=A0A9N9H982_FUNMO|nr:11978_t:CDS:2 [Funneliformis mosseae]